MSRVGVMQLTSSLQLGGLERVAVNLANLLPRDRYDAHLCATRAGGPLREELAADVSVLALDRAGRLDDLREVGRLVRYVREHGIDILHCHGDSVFVASLASLRLPGVMLVWHDHFGEYAFMTRPRWLYRLGTHRVHGIISVNEPLATWATDELGFRKDRVWYVSNFVTHPETRGATPDLPGVPGKRIVCVANLRLQKDHFNLVRAMEQVVREEPDAHALLVGATVDEDYAERLRREIVARGLTNQVTILGQRSDTPDLLQTADVGVLSSESEGLPLALIEYGMAGLPSVATDVGQCPDVMEGGEAGILVPPRDSAALAEGLLRLLRSAAERERIGERFRRWVVSRYGPETGMQQVASVYDTLLADRDGSSR